MANYQLRAIKCIILSFEKKEQIDLIGLYITFLKMNCMIVQTKLRWQKKTIFT